MQHYLRLQQQRPLNNNHSQFKKRIMNCRILILRTHLKQVNYKNQSSKYQYVKQQNQQQSNIVVNDNGKVGENHSHMR